MWLAARPNVTPSMARAWYTHVVAGKFVKRIRHFSGKVSLEAISNPSAPLRLEHHCRMQETLTSLVGEHLKSKRPSKQKFIQTLIESENVHIVTFGENYAALRHDGNYRNAGIRLASWRSIPAATRQILWSKMLRGKVANADLFATRS